MASKAVATGFTVGDGFRLGIGFIIAQIFFMIIGGVCWRDGSMAVDAQVSFGNSR